MLLTRLVVRFNEPALPGQTIATRCWEYREGVLVFETTAEDGDIIIRDRPAEPPAG